MDQTSIPVLKQRSYIGKKPIIPSTLTDTLCSNLGIQGLLEKLNTTLSMSDTLFTPQVYSVLEDCIMQKWDFGTAFAYLCPFWDNNLVTICAWTLQEINQNPIIGGNTGDEGLQARFEEKISSLQHNTYRLYDVLSEMQKRVSTHPVDKIAGMAYVVGSGSIPAYYGKQSEEDAWIALVDMIPDWSQADLLFLYPKPGDGQKRWRPSWEQVMTDSKLPSQQLDRGPFIGYDIDSKIDLDSCYYDRYIIEQDFVHGLSD
ncbi:hypothetical protein EDD85DRAFT_981189 [Armillaria nabsnona]|nr:hypothetical protein EDD85DRAFT_981189 [Armillaria nabsnona]